MKDLYRAFLAAICRVRTSFRAFSLFVIGALWVVAFPVPRAMAQCSDPPTAVIDLTGPADPSTCSGSAQTFEFSASNSSFGDVPLGRHSYLWSVTLEGSPVTDGLGNDDEETFEFTPPANASGAAQAYTVELTVFDSNDSNCSGAATTEVTVFPLPNADFSVSASSDGSGTRVCAGGSFTFDASASTGGDGAAINDYIWEVDGASQSEDGPTFDFDPADPSGSDFVASYEVSLVVEDANGCESPAFTEEVFVINQIPDASIDGESDGQATVCSGSDVSFSLDNYDGSDSGLSVSWDFDLDNAGTNTSTAEAPTFNFTQTDGESTRTYRVQATYTYDDGAFACDLVSQELTVVVGGNPAPAFTISPLPPGGGSEAGTGDVRVCHNSSVTFEDVSAESSTSRQWTIQVGSDPAQSAGSGQTFNQTLTVPNGQASETYTVTLTHVNDYSDGVSCQRQVSRTVTVYRPQVDFTPSVNIACSGETVTFTSSTQAVGAGGLAYAWDFGDGTTDNGATVSHDFPGLTGAGSQQFTVRLTATDNSGCQDVVTRNVRIVRQPVAAVGSTDNGNFCSDFNSFDFSSSGSTALGGSVSYAWDLGDGRTRGNVSNVNNVVYSDVFGEGTQNYTVSLTVTNTVNGVSCTASNDVNVSIFRKARLRLQEGDDGANDWTICADFAQLGTASELGFRDARVGVPAAEQTNFDDIARIEVDWGDGSPLEVLNGANNGSPYDLLNPTDLAVQTFSVLLRLSWMKKRVQIGF